MYLKIALFFLISIPFLSRIHAQSDSLLLRQKDEMDKRMRILEKMMREDPKAAKDSLAKVRLTRQKESSRSRIEGYRNHPSLEELKEIDLSNGDFEEIPEFIWKAKNLEVLLLNDNRIRKLPKELAELPMLKRLYWERNELDKRRFKLPKLPNIEKLDLTGNYLNKLPNLRRMTGLRTLVLEENEFTSVPIRRVKRLKTLREVDLSSNPMVLGKKRYDKLDWLPVIKFNRCNLDSIHPSFYKMTGLTELQLQINKLESLPDGISNLTNLSKLSFYKNQLKSLPKDLYQMKDLEVIDLYYNQLTTIPDEIGEMKSLEILYLSFNKLYSLSEEIGKLENLKQLYLHHNRFSELPQTIAGLTNLRTLHVNENYLSEFPMQVLGLTNLKDLDVSNTDITTIPIEVESMNLTEFFYRELTINYNSIRNAHIQPMIVRMQDNGVTVSPRIKEVVVESQ